MSKNIIICGVLVFFALSMNVALSEMQYPQEMMDVSAPYPDATITHNSKAINGTVMVQMESNDDLDSIFEFYKTALAANGWTITSESQLEGLSGLVGVKGSNNVSVNLIASGQSGKSMIMLVLAPKQ